MAKSTTGNKDPQSTQTSDRRRRSPGKAQNGADETTTQPARPRRRTVSRPVAGGEKVVGFGESASEQFPRATEVVEGTREVDVPHEQIAVRAYHLYLERGGRGGDDFQDWITAERELRQRAAGHRVSR
jgi:hypothetical protein